MYVGDSIVRIARGLDVRKQLITKKARSWRHWLKRPKTSQDLVAIVPCHPGRCDLAGLLTYVEDRRTAHVGTAVRQVDRVLGVLGKAGDKLLAAPDDLMRLPASASHLARHQHVAAFTVSSSKGVTGQRAWGRLVPSHDRPRVQSPGQRHPYALLAVEVPGQVS